MSQDSPGPEPSSESPVPTRITVAICTYNRSRLLRTTLESLTELEVPPRLDWELLVVDNASTDETSEVLEAFEGRLPLRPRAPAGALPRPQPGSGGNAGPLRDLDQR